MIIVYWEDPDEPDFAINRDFQMFKGPKKFKIWALKKMKECPNLKMRVFKAKEVALKIIKVPIKIIFESDK